MELAAWTGNTDHSAGAVGFHRCPHHQTTQRGEMTAGQAGFHPLGKPARRFVLQKKILERGDHQCGSEYDRRRRGQTQDRLE